MFTNNSFLCFTKNRFIITFYSSRPTTPSILCPCLSLCKSIQQHYFHALFEILSRFSPFRLSDILNWATIHFYSMTLNDTTNHYTNTKAKSWNSLSIGGNTCLFHDYLVFKNHSFIFLLSLNLLLCHHHEHLPNANLEPEGCSDDYFFAHLEFHYDCMRFFSFSPRSLLFSSWLFSLWRGESTSQQIIPSSISLAIL